MADEIVIGENNYVIIQRQGYTKLQKLKLGGTITLGKDVIELDNVIGNKYYDTFQMVLKGNSKRLYQAQKVAEPTNISQINVEQSGSDNRNIVDDGSSQGLSFQEINQFRCDALSSNDIVQKLVDNSKTFASKTEYSQEKYMKKKEKKYFEYFQVRKPSIRLLVQMFYRQDPNKTLGIRIDDLSQILSYSDVQSNGNFLLYDSGTSGLMAAALMDRMGFNTQATLVHMHPGNQCQKNAVLAMNFPKELLDRCINVNIYSVLRCFYQESIKNDQEAEISTESGKRTAQEAGLENPNPKRPCWQFENESACKVLEEKVDLVLITSKEHPVNLAKELGSFLKPGRPLVVFNLNREPLQDLYFHLKNTRDYICVRIFNNFTRSYQILPDRTHPEVNMNFGGHILTAYKTSV